jgi:hypothetical protein
MLHHILRVDQVVLVGMQVIRHELTHRRVAVFNSPIRDVVSERLDTEHSQRLYVEPSARSEIENALTLFDAEQPAKVVCP